MDLATIIPYVLGAAAAILGHKLGVPIPMLPPPTPGPLTPAPSPLTPSPVVPSPTPGPTPQPVHPVDRPTTAFLAYLWQVKAGVVRLDDLDTITLGQIREMLASMTPAPTPKQ